MVSGALGVAVVGSLVSSLYSDRRRRLARRAARPGPGGGRGLGRGGERDRGRTFLRNAASALLATTGDAFTQAMGIGLLVAAALAGAMAVVVLRFLPAREPADAHSHEPRAPAALSRRRPSVRTEGRRLDDPRRAGPRCRLLGDQAGLDMPAANGQRVRTEFAPIERFVREEMEAQRIPGLALGIIEDDRITYLRGFGKADDSGGR